MNWNLPIGLNQGWRAIGEELVGLVERFRLKGHLF
jgi:hypothetical protein